MVGVTTLLFVYVYPAKTIPIVQRVWGPRKQLANIFISLKCRLVLGRTNAATCEMHVVFGLPQLGRTCKPCLELFR